VSNPLSKSKWQQFCRQLKGAEISEISVTRREGKDKVSIQYGALSKKTRQKLTGEWSIPRAGRSEDEVKADVKAFLAQARKLFLVRRGEGLQGDDWADAAQDAAPIAPLKAEATTKE
jgi:hypothetical protein